MIASFQLKAGTASYRCVDLPAFAGDALQRMPWVHRVLLENVLRRGGRDAKRFGAALVQARGRAGNTEITFHPNRLLMHDTTFTPAFVDIAAMRDQLAKCGVDPSQLNPVVPVDVSVDHSIAVDHFGVPDALARNTAADFRRNHSRYRFMKWAAAAIKGVRIHPPGSGIMHTINLERLTPVVASGEWQGELWAYPDTLIGTDSHTTMVNGIGVLAWGVGGLEAESVLFGLPVTLRIPDVVGVRLVGALPTTAMATDLVLVVTETLRKMPLAGRFVEFFGPGVSSISAGTRAVVANMAPEYGASSGAFPIDDATVRYLFSTGRPPNLIELVEAFAKRQRLWFDAEAEPQYSDVVEIDLSRVTMSLAGPRRPQDRLSPSATKSAVSSCLPDRPLQTSNNGTPGDGAVAIAAITSCTNTSDPRLIIAAALVARKARRFGLAPPSWVKTSCAPGSPAIRAHLERAGLMEDLEALGFGIVGYGCTTCIGNSGPLTPEMTRAMAEQGILPAAVLSGNRNFAGRVHPDLDVAFLASPPLVVAYAVAGDVTRNLLEDPVGISSPAGAPVYLSDLWPSEEEIAAAVDVLSPDDVARSYESAAHNPWWDAIEAPSGPQFDWDPTSTDLRPPPFATADSTTLLGHFVAHPLLVLGDDVTTDHISPAGPIAAASDAGRYLIASGENPLDLNVFAARRGNWEVMRRGLFTNRSVRNLLAPELAAGQTRHAPSGEAMPIWRAAERYVAERVPLLIWAGARYGAGSSRDWAAKGISMLGVRAVLATSFERIHRSNLIGMGVLPLRVPTDLHPERVCLRTGDRVEIRADVELLAPHASIAVRIVREDGRIEPFDAVAAVETALEVTLLRSGGMIPHILRSALMDAQASALVPLPRHLD